MARRKQRKVEYTRIRVDSGHQRRILTLMALLGILGFLPGVLQLYKLMVTEHDFYVAKARNNQTRTTLVAAHRGTIYDRNMQILACQETVENVYLDPRELRQAEEDVEKIASDLGQILGKEADWILKKASNTAMRYQQIGVNVDQETADRVRAYILQNEISGVHMEPSARRYYPLGTLAAQVIGFTNASGTGSEGIEATYNGYLSGSVEKVITTKGNNEMDMPFSLEEYCNAIPGADVILTLDATVQACLEKQMQTAIDRYDVRNGAFGLVMEVKTGAILAMATLGSYDPNAYLEIWDSETAKKLEQMRLEYLAQAPESQAYFEGQEIYRQALHAAQLKQWRNRVLSDGYEPGSTFKVLTMAAALDSGAIDLNTHFHCRGSEQIPGRSQLLHCWRSTGHGAENTAQALQNSCNIAFAHIALKMGGETFYSYVEKFGILEKTGIDLRGESKGIFFDRSLVTDTEKWGTASLTSGSFGQTFKITPLQLVRAIASVVNGGYLMEPYLVSEILDSHGNTLLKQEPTVVRQVISAETSKIMCGLLESVVTDGTAKNASVSGFSIGGKTGTSEKIDIFDENGQRVTDKIVSFVGVAPMDDPEYIVLVALDTPSKSTGIYISGGVMAAPTVGAVMADILPYLGAKQQFAPDDPAGKIVIMPQLLGFTSKEAEEALKNAGLAMTGQGSGDSVTAQIPAAGQPLPGGSHALVYFGEAEDMTLVEVPNFYGMNRQQASDAAGRLGLYILVSGNPKVDLRVTVTNQETAPGTMVPKGTTIRLEFTDMAAAD